MYIDIELLGTTAKEYAEMAGRTDVNVFDFVHAYSDMVCIMFMVVFACHCSANTPLQHPGDEKKLLEDFNKFIDKKYEVPFARGTIANLI